MVEYQTFNLGVEGSNPSAPTKIISEVLMTLLEAAESLSDILHELEASGTVLNKSQDLRWFDASMIINTSFIDTSTENK